MYKVRILELAQKDIKDNALWYNDKKKGIKIKSWGEIDKQD